jgi:hypothetical protein
MTSINSGSSRNDGEKRIKAAKQRMSKASKAVENGVAKMAAVAVGSWQ